MPTLLLATTNPGKVREFRALLDGCGWDMVTPSDVGVSLEVEETGDTYAENARLKALAYAKASGLVALADDSGLEIDELYGAPGVHSARFAGAETPHTEKVSLLLERLRQTPEHRRGARFRAVIVIATPGGDVHEAEGVCEGSIAREPRGSGGFGYDPIFLVAEDAQGRTMAELSDAEKNRISHRARAAAIACEELRRLAVAPRPPLPMPGDDETQDPTPHRHSLPTDEEHRLTHVDETGRAHMVDVSGKADTAREAVARGRVTMQPETLRLILAGEVAKGNVLTTAQIAGIMAAKRTHELIPMCHPLLLSKVDVRLDPDESSSAVNIEALVRTTGPTGVEMEALTAVSVAGLTIYDMCKAVDRGMRIEAVRLVRKTGGKSGEILLEE